MKKATYFIVMVLSIVGAFLAGSIVNQRGDVDGGPADAARRAAAPTRETSVRAPPRASCFRMTGGPSPPG
jgi:hypothetical protein